METMQRQNLTRAAAGATTQTVVSKELAAQRVWLTLIVVLGQLLVVLAVVWVDVPHVARVSALGAGTGLECASLLPARGDTPITDASGPTPRDSGEDAGDDEELLSGPYTVRLPSAFAGAGAHTSIPPDAPRSRERGKAPERPPQS